MFFEQNFKLTLEDIDKNTYITNKAILRYFENTATYHSDSIGRGLNSISDNGQTWIVLDWHVKVIKRVKYGESVKVRTWSRGTAKFFAYRDYELIDELGNVCAIGSSRWILRDISQNKMTLLSEEMMKDYQCEDRKVLPDEEFAKIHIPEEFSNEFSYTVLRKDIDFNNHMHNLYHFDLAYETIPEEIYNNSLFDNFRITYKREIKLGQKIASKYALVDGKHLVYISNSDGEMNSIIELW